jgi:F-type H+-transporting ATPase subunit c
MLEIMNVLPMMLAENSITLDSKAFGMLGGVIGCGLIVMGAAKGIGNLAGKATEAIARQPEMGGRIFTTMIIAAALIEGVTLFALIICMLAVIAP